MSNTCGLCNRTYVWPPDLKRHLKSKYGQQKSALKQQQPYTRTPEQQPYTFTPEQQQQQPPPAPAAAAAAERGIYATTAAAATAAERNRLRLYSFSSAIDKISDKTKHIMKISHINVNIYDKAVTSQQK